MTPKFRPFAFRRLLIAAAGASLAFSAAPAKGAVFFWAGPNGHDGTSDGYLEGGQAFNNYSSAAPKYVTTGTARKLQFNNIGAFLANPGSALVFTEFSKNVTVTVGAQTPTFATGTSPYSPLNADDMYSSSGKDFDPLTVLTGAGVKIIGGSMDGGSKSKTFLSVENSGSLELNNINYFSGQAKISGNLTVSNAKALGATGVGNETIVQTQGTLTLVGGVAITDPETLILNGTDNAASLINSSGSNVYSGPVRLEGNKTATIAISDATSLQFNGQITNNLSSSNPEQLILKLGASSNVTISGGIDDYSTSASTVMSLRITALSSTPTSTTPGTATINSNPIKIGSSLNIGGATVNLYSQIQAAHSAGTSPQLSVRLGDENGAGNLNVYGTTALDYISSYVVNSGTFSADYIKSNSSLEIGASGYVNLMSVDLTLTGAVIRNQNTTPNSLNFSATTGTVTLTNGIGSTIAGTPSPGAVHFGSNAVIGTVSTTPGLAVQGGLADGIITVDGNLTTPYIAGGTTIVKGDLTVVTGGTLSTSAETTPSGFIRGDGNSFATSLNVSGNITAGNIKTINGNNLTVTVGGNLRLTNTSGAISGGSIGVNANVYADEITGGAVTIARQLFANSNSSGPSIAGGTVTINGTSASAINIFSGGTLYLNSPSSGIKQFTGGDIILKTGSNLTITAGNVIGQFAGVGLRMSQSTGVVTVTGVLSANATFNIPSNVQNISSGTVNFNANASLGSMTGGTANITSGMQLVMGGNQSSVATIAGSGSVGFYTGTTPLTLSGTNTYSGGTSLQNGTTLCVGNSSALGTGKLSISGGTLASTANSLNTITVPVDVFGSIVLGHATYNGGLVLAGAMDLQGGTRAITANSDATISGAITNGSIVKEGSAKLTITGSYSGPIAINGGTLGGTTTSLTAPTYTVNNGTTLELSQNTDGTFGSIITGAGSLAKSGTGKVTLTGANAYATGTAGGTYVSGGTLSGTTDSIRGNVTTSGSGILEFNQAAATTGNFGGTFSGTGTIAKVGTGTLNLSSTISTGGISVTAGTLCAQNNIVNATGLVSVSSGGVLLAPHGINAGSLNISGSSFDVASGIKVTAGTVSINSGTLTNNGTIVGLVTVGSTGTLKGSGTITGGVTVNGGTVTIGNSPGIMTLSSGNHSQVGGTFISEIGGTAPGTGNGFHDQYIISNGTFAISGSATLQLNSWAKADTTTFVPVRGDSFKVINASGGLTGNFTTLTNNLDPSQIIVFAQHTGVAYATGLTTSQTFGNYTSDATKKTIYDSIWSAAVTSGGSASAKFIDGTSSNGQLAVAIIKNASINYSDLSPESYFSLSDYAVTVTRAATDAALNQPSYLKVKRWSVGADYNIVNSTFKGGSSTAFDRTLTSQTGFVVVNYDASNDSTIGFFAGFNSGKTSTNSTRFDYDGTLLGVTGNFHFNTRYPFNLKAALTNADLNLDVSRSFMGVAGAASLTNQKIKETSLSVQAEIETMRRDRAMVYATLGFTYDNFSAPTLIENGASTALKIDALNQNFIMASAGVAAKYYKSTKMTYDVSAKLEKSFGGGSLKSTFMGTTSTLDNPSGSQTVLALGGGLTYKVNASTVFLAGLELRGSSDYTGDARLNASYRKKF